MKTKYETVTDTKLELPNSLIESVKNRRAIPFLGAGSSKEARDKNGRMPPDADQLRDILANKYFGREIENRDLKSFDPDLRAIYEDKYSYPTARTRLAKIVG